MAQAKECDRCGALYKGSIFEQDYFIRPISEQDYFIRPMDSISTTTLDICPDCNSSLVEWMGFMKQNKE